MRAGRTGLATAIATLAVVAPAAAQAASPGDRVETPVRSSAPDAGVVEESYVRIYEPLPASVPAHPAECDWLGYLRFRSATGPEDASQADAVLVAQAGVIGGASSLDQIARHTVANAAAQGAHVEFWALDRRSNCLEDHTGIEAAKAARDWRVALDYYYGGKEVDGRRFAGFLTSAQVPWLAEIGVAQTMHDWRAVMARGLPDPELRRRKLLCGGHSLGGALTGVFAGWDFDGDPKTDGDLGRNECAGFFILDSDPDPLAAELGGLERAALEVLGDASPDAIEAGMRSGALPRIFDIGAFYGPEILALIGMPALAAYYDPDEVGLVKRLPHSPIVDLNLRLIFSRDAAAFATGTPDIRDYNLTNEALFGALVDDNSQPFFADQISLGTFDGGPVVEKTFPTPSGPPELGAASVLLNGRRPLMIPAVPAGPVYSWRNYDAVGAPDAPRQVDGSGRPFTSPAQETSDIREVARAWFEAPADFTTHYESMRIVVDFLRTVVGDYSGALRDLRQPRALDTLPHIRILAGDNTFGAGAPDPPPDNTVVLPGYTHIDVISAAARQNDGQPERGAARLTSFVLERTGFRAPAPAAARPAIRLSVEPRRVRAGERVRLRVRARSSARGCRRGVTILVAGRRVRTNGRGRARLSVTPRRPGRMRLTARKRGCLPASAFVRVMGR